jgi:hypothetical protein
MTGLRERLAEFREANSVPALGGGVVRRDA